MGGTSGDADRLFSNGDTATRRGDWVRVVGGQWFLGGWVASDPGGTKGSVSRRGAEAQGRRIVAGVAIVGVDPLGFCVTGIHRGFDISILRVATNAPVQVIVFERYGFKIGD